MCVGLSSHQAVENKARRQIHPEQNQVCGEPHEHFVPTPVQTLCQGLLMLGERRSHRTGKRVHLELHKHNDKKKEKDFKQTVIQYKFNTHK